MGGASSCVRKQPVHPAPPVLTLGRYSSYSVSLKDTTPVSSDKEPELHTPKAAKKNTALFGFLSVVSPQSANPSSNYASEKIINIAAEFWNSKISVLSFDDQMELSVSFFLDMTVKDKSIMAIGNQNYSANKRFKIRTLSLKFLNMVGWLIRILRGEYAKPTEGARALKTLGSIHKAMGVRSEHFAVMLTSLHDTFAHYFPHEYGIKQQYAFDYLLSVASNLMLGEAVALPSGDDSAEYLSSLQSCLHSEVGREYLYRYLQQTWCDEIVIYLQNIRRFEQQTTDKGRFMIARNIADVSINADSDVAVNISYESRLNVMRLMSEYEEQFRLKSGIEISGAMFEDVTHAMHRLIHQNHWTQFTKGIENMSISKKQ